MSSFLEQQMQKHCAKLRDEMIAAQANSLKEQATLSRKLESVSKEKRDLYRQLMITQKENRAAKEQLEELLAEKALLVKRLECASKEFKINSKSKKAALDNLEESQVTITSLKIELGKISHDKENLENEFKILHTEHKNLKDRLAKYEPPTHNSFSSKIDNNKENIESKNAVINVSKDNIESQKDAQSVQMRLINLEESLEKLKLSNWDKKDDKKKTPSSTACSCPDASEQSPIQTDTDEFENFVASITSRAECPLVGQTKKVVKKLLMGSNNSTDEKRRRILDSTESSGDEYSNASKNYKCFIEHVEYPFETVENLLKCVTHLQSPKMDRLNLGVSDEVSNNDTTINPNEDDTDD